MFLYFLVIVVVIALIFLLLSAPLYWLAHIEGLPSQYNGGYGFATMVLMLILLPVNAVIAAVAYVAWTNTLDRPPPWPFWVVLAILDFAVVQACLIWVPSSAPPP